MFPGTTEENLLWLEKAIDDDDDDTDDDDDDDDFWLGQHNGPCHIQAKYLMKRMRIVC